MLRQAWIHNEVNLSEVVEVFIIYLGQQEDAISEAGCQSRPWPKEKNDEHERFHVRHKSRAASNVSWYYMEALFTWWKNMSWVY